MITKKSITAEEYREWYEKENISKKGNERKPIRHLEGDLQKSCVKWFKLQYPHILIFAIPNGGARNHITAAILNGQGVIPGIPDLMIAQATNKYNGLFIEMKIGKGKLTPQQVAIHKQLNDVCFKVETCYTIEQFIDAVSNYFHN